MCFGKKEKKQNLGEVKIHKPREPKILIIGAGAAGIACATKLLEFGFKDVIIYEAQDRIGGRIHTIPFADNVVDMGAQWCHGEEGNVVYEMVKHLNILGHDEDCYNKSNFIRSDGLPLDDDTIDRLKNILATIFENRHKGLPSYKGSYGAYLEEKFLEAFDDSKNDDIDELEAMEFFVNFLKIEGAETASDVHNVSAAGFLSYWQCPGNYMLNWQQSGYLTFLRLLMNASDDDPLGILKEHIHFDMCVDRLCWERDDNMIEVTCSNNNQTLLVDHVVLTVSLGVLKDKHAQMFLPALPENKIEAIMATGFGAILKIYVEFSVGFWPADWCGFNALWTIFDLEDLKNGSRSWLSEVFGFYRVSCQPRILLGWCGGSNVHEIEKMQISDIQKDVMFMLKKFLPKFKIPRPQRVHISSWATNDNFLGTYSYQSMLLPEIGPCNPILAQPLSILAYAPLQYYENEMSENISNTSVERALTVKPIILFAGEATSTHFFSTVHGATETGWREAKRLAGFYDKQI